MNNQNDVVIVSAVRTPFSKFGGALKEIHSTDLGVIVINESLKRAGMTGEDLDEVYYGMCDQAEAALYDNVNARQAILRAGLPKGFTPPSKLMAARDVPAHCVLCFFGEVIQALQDTHEAVAIIGGRYINPVGTLPGGVSKPISEQERVRLEQIGQGCVDFG